MEIPLSPRNQDWREHRRFRAWQLYQQGWKQKDIADKLDATQGAVSQWIKRAKTQGEQALLRRKATGRPPKLSPEQKQQLPALLLCGAPTFGFSGDLWTAQRIAVVIQQEFGVTYHPDTIGDLLKACGWSYQKPICRATQRNEQALQDWNDTRLPALKKGPKQAGINSCL